MAISLAALQAPPMVAFFNLCTRTPILTNSSPYPSPISPIFGSWAHLLCLFFLSSLKELVEGSLEAKRHRGAHSMYLVNQASASDCNLQRVLAALLLNSEKLPSPLCKNRRVCLCDTVIDVLCSDISPLHPSRQQSSMSHSLWLVEILRCMSRPWTVVSGYSTIPSY
ncbi:uncharacterized protein LOC105421261 [Amborella trichopoda]|uniref:uncharacterized protein LOC105421261 n=1 Tax=Amborella trichopoda TaxID=13333 RepID=UPI0005D328A6|nr:uncharacterized protein LOC105421261 [Amborella trichopoda]|eukprot:XP_011626269.1 uncharacterized protein LOC105421261 [Amborella trichopoda]